MPGTPFVLRNGPSRTPERFAAWNRWAEYGLIAFQRYANPVPQRWDQAFGSF